MSLTRNTGEYAISVALAGAALLTVWLLRSSWQPTSLQDVASSAEDFILRTTGIGAQVPEIAGYEKVKTFRLGRYRAGIYRALTAPLAFTPGRFVIYRDGQPVFRLETLEGAREPWTSLYDFEGRPESPGRGNRSRPLYTRRLTGNEQPDVIVGRYSGGDHCCTAVTILELGKESVRELGRIEGLEGFPFEGLELRKIDRDHAWELIAHRGYRAPCASPQDAVDVLSVYAYRDGAYVDETSRFTDFLRGLLEQDLAKWSRGKVRTLHLLETLAIDYAALGQRDQGQRFFAANLPLFIDELRASGVDPGACLGNLESLLDRLPGRLPGSVSPGAP